MGGTEFSLDNHVYRGQPAPPIPLRGAFAQSGELNIEVIQILSDTPSAFRDMFAAGQGGFHHAAMFCDDYEADKARFVASGMAVASEFTTNFGAKICYMDARDTLGHMIELYPQNAIIRAMYQQARDAALTWDGRSLIIPWQ
ncbi:MAG: VOC family protein [Sphingopyxis sp.]